MILFCFLQRMFRSCLTLMSWKGKSAISLRLDSYFYSVTCSLKNTIWQMWGTKLLIHILMGSWGSYSSALLSTNGCHIIEALKPVYESILSWGIRNTNTRMHHPRVGSICLMHIFSWPSSQLVSWLHNCSKRLHNFWWSPSDNGLLPKSWPSDVLCVR